MSKRKTFVVCLLAVLFGTFLGFYCVNPYSGKIALPELILQLSGSRGEFVLGFSANELLAFAMDMIPGWLLEAFFGIALYRHFCTASIYVFSRCADRKRWYWKEILCVGINVFLFQFILVVSAVIISLVQFEVTINFPGIVLALYHVFLHSLWIYSAIVLVNLIALKAGSSMAFTGVIFAQTFAVAMLGLGQVVDKFYPDKVMAKALIVKLNPVSNLILGWHDSFIPSVDSALKNFIGIPCTSFHLEYSLVFLVIVNIIILKIGSVIIGKHDLLISDAEMGVA